MDGNAPSEGERAFFREAVYRKQANQWLGELSLVHPVPVGVVLAVAATVIIALAVFLISAAYTQRVRIEGALVPSKGVITVVAPVAGTVQDVMPSEGAHVRRGEAMALLLAQRRTRDGESITEVDANIGARRTELNMGLRLSADAERSQRSELLARAQTLRATLASLRQESEAVIARLELARGSLSRIESLRKDRLVSEIEAARYENDALLRKSEKAAIDRQILTAEQDLDSIAAQLRQTGTASASDRAALRGQLALLAQEAIENKSRGETVVTATLSGTVSARLVEPGQVVETAEPLARIVPLGSTLEAHFLVPSRVVGLLEEGQEVRIAYRAFPYQKYGLHEGVVRKVSLTPVPGGGTEEMYRAVVALASQDVTLDGKRFALKPGMQLEADVMLERSSLLATLAAPLKSLLKQIP